GSEPGIFSMDAAIVQKLQRRPVVVHLPEEVRQRDQHQKDDSPGGVPREEDLSLGREQKGEGKRDEEEGHRRLVEEAKPGRDAEDRPPEARAAAPQNEDQRKDAGHPEGGLPTVHGEE